MRDYDKARQRCRMNEWQVEERDARHAMNAGATAKRCWRGLVRSPWFATWGEVADWQLKQPAGAGLEKGRL